MLLRQQLGEYFMISGISQGIDSNGEDVVGDGDWDQLIEQAKAGNDLALLEIVKQFEVYLLMVAKTRIGNSLQAKFGASDIVQISLMEARESIEEFNGTSEGEMRQWLKRIVVNNLLDQTKQYTGTRKRSLAREKSMGLLDFQSGQGTPSVMIRREESDAELKQLVSELPEKQRYVVEARHRFGMSNSDIAVQLGTSESNVRQLWSRAAKHLRNGLLDL